MFESRLGKHPQGFKSVSIRSPSSTTKSYSVWDVSHMTFSLAMRKNIWKTREASLPSSPGLPFFLFLHLTEAKKGGNYHATKV